MRAISTVSLTSLAHRASGIAIVLALASAGAARAETEGDKAPATEVGEVLVTASKRTEA